MKSAFKSDRELDNEIEYLEQNIPKEIVDNLHHKYKQKYMR